MTLTATVLTFTGNKCSTDSVGGTGPLVNCSPGSFINQTYVDSATVNVSYLAGGTAGLFAMQAWPSGFGNATYSNLADAAYGFFGSNTIQITFAPLGGGTVTLNSFNVGTFLGPRNFTAVVIDLATNTVVFSVTLNVANQVFPIAPLLSPGVSSAVGLRLALINTDTFNVGLSNIDFNVANAPSGIPEPSSYAMLLLGAAAGIYRFGKLKKSS